MVDMFHKQGRGTRIGLISLLLVAAFLGVLYYPRGSHSADDALVHEDNHDESFTFVDMHEAIGSLEHAATRHLVHLGGLAGSATGIRARIQNFYESGVQRLEDCSTSSNPESCEVETAVEDISLMLAMLEEIDFFAENAAETGLNHNKIQAAYTFVRHNMQKLVKGAMDVSLSGEVSTLEESSASLKTVVSDLAACAMRIAADSLDVVKYARLTNKYISAMKSGGKLSMKNIMAQGAKALGIKGTGEKNTSVLGPGMEDLIELNLDDFDLDDFLEEDETGAETAG